MMIIEKHRRSIAKAVAYRAISIVLLATLSWIFTGSFVKMTAITITYQTISIVGYYMYERIWGHISWGREAAQD